MSPDELLKAIIKDPESDQLRLDYANACATADPDRANFIRLQIEARNLVRLGKRSTTSTAAIRDLLYKTGNGQRWAGPIADRIGWYDFSGGFVEDIEIDAAAFLQEGEELYCLAPIRRLYLRNVAAVAESLFRSPLLDRIVSLSIESQKLNDAHIALLAASPYLRHLGCLGLAGNQVTTAGLESLMRSEGLPSLKYTDFFSCPVYKTDLGEEYADELGHIIYVKEGLWPIEERLGRKTWLHTVSDSGLGYTLPSAY